VKEKSGGKSAPPPATPAQQPGSSTPVCESSDQHIIQPELLRELPGRTVSKSNLR
jgi:hypothetical protein